jgi:hypothetical protein
MYTHCSWSNFGPPFCPHNDALAITSSVFRRCGFCEGRAIFSPSHPSTHHDRSSAKTYSRTILYPINVTFIHLHVTSLDVKNKICSSRATSKNISSLCLIRQHLHVNNMEWARIHCPTQICSVPFFVSRGKDTKSLFFDESWVWSMSHDDWCTIRQDE